jgi:nucleotide-binding universal stress UspA family protein
MVIDLLDPKIYTAGDIERVGGFHPLGTLLKDDEFSSELAAEYYFRLAAGIDHAIRTAGARTFVFTSLTEGSGTSTVVEKTSHKLIELGLRTLTIVASDADAPVIYSNESRQNSELLVRPRPLDSEELQYRPERSQNSALASFGDSAEGARRRAEHEPPAPNPVARAIHQAGTQYDAVLIDSNPLLLSANTEYLARISDATVLIIASAEATKPQLNRAARLLERLNVPGVAIVLNKIAMARADRALKNDLQQYEQSLDRQRRTNNRKPVWQHKEKIHSDIEAEREIMVEPAPESNPTPSEEIQTAV